MALNYTGMAWMRRGPALLRAALERGTVTLSQLANECGVGPRSVAAWAQTAARVGEPIRCEAPPEQYLGKIANACGFASTVDLVAELNRADDPPAPAPTE